MIDRKKKLRLTQFFLLFFGMLIIYFTYYNNKTIDKNNEIVSKENKDIFKKRDEENIKKEKDLFFNIEYTGLDLNGNRYILLAEKANFNDAKPEIVYMSVVKATFYFKDETILYVWSDKGIYNNKTLDMNFENNVKARYLSSELFAEKAEYSNSKNYLSIYDNVKINDIKGNLIADKLVFDITKQKLDITSFNNGKINANVNLNEKRF